MTRVQLRASPIELLEIQGLSERVGQPAAAKAFLFSRGMWPESGWDDGAIRASALRYYVDAPATSQCQYLLERAWLYAASGQLPGLEVRFPHVERATRS